MVAGMVSAAVVTSISQRREAKEFERRLQARGESDI
jgi:hypothetical protein